MTSSVLMSSNIIRSKSPFPSDTIKGNSDYLVRHSNSFRDQFLDIGNQFDELGGHFEALKGHSDNVNGNF